MYWMELNHNCNEPPLKSTKFLHKLAPSQALQALLARDYRKWWVIKIKIARSWIRKHFSFKKIFANKCYTFDQKHHANIFVPPFVKILISHSWIMRQLDSWRRIISSSIDHLSFIIKWKVTNSFCKHPTFVKKLKTSLFLFLEIYTQMAKYFYYYTGATRTTKYQLYIYNPSNKLFVLPDSSFEVFKVLLRQIVSITLCKTRPWQSFQLEDRIMRGFM